MTIKETYNQEPLDIEFSIIAYDDFVLNETIKHFNDAYNMDIEIVGFIHDEVTFVVLKSSTMNPSKVFEFGYFYGCALTQARIEKKVNY